VQDLSEQDAAKSLRFLRSMYGPSHGFISKFDREQIPEVLKLVGGRTSHLSRVARAPNMLGERCLFATVDMSSSFVTDEAQNMVEVEKNWMLSKWVCCPVFQRTALLT
jgi:hypothetical protein